MVKENDKVTWPAEWGEVRSGVVVEKTPDGEWVTVAPCDSEDWEQMPTANVTVVNDGEDA
jgi:hypothetical protein